MPTCDLQEATGRTGFPRRFTEGREAICTPGQSVARTAANYFAGAALGYDIIETFGSGILSIVDPIPRFKWAPAASAQNQLDFLACRGQAAGVHLFSSFAFSIEPFDVVIWTLAAVLVVTAIIAFLSLLNLISLEEEYKKKLFQALILEVVVVSVGAFGKYLAGRTATDGNHGPGSASAPALTPAPSSNKNESKVSVDDAATAARQAQASSTPAQVSATPSDSASQSAPVTAPKARGRIPDATTKMIRDMNWRGIESAATRTDRAANERFVTKSDVDTYEERRPGTGFVSNGTLHTYPPDNGVGYVLLSIPRTAISFTARLRNHAGGGGGKWVASALVDGKLQNLNRYEETREFSSKDDETFVVINLSPGTSRKLQLQVNAKGDAGGDDPEWENAYWTFRTATRRQVENLLSATEPLPKHDTYGMRVLLGKFIEFYTNNDPVREKALMDVFPESDTQIQSKALDEAIGHLKSLLDELPKD